jgi:hypothetical protein
MTTSPAATLELALPMVSQADPEEVPELASLPVGET